MDSKEFPVIGTIRKAFDTYKGNFALYTGLSMLSISIVAFAWVIGSLTGMLVAFMLVSSTFVSLGLAYAAVRTFKGEDTDFGTFFGVYNLYPIYLISSFIAFFGVGTAAVFFAIMLFGVFVVMIKTALYIKIATVAVTSIPLLAPGLVIAARIQFYTFMMAEAETRSGRLVFETLERSWDTTKGRTFDILLMDFALLFMNVFAAGLFGLGLRIAILPISFVGLIALIVSIPVSVLTLMHTYEALRRETEQSNVKIEQANAEAEQVDTKTEKPV
jgi:hypothetical protein